MSLGSVYLEYFQTYLTREGYEVRIAADANAAMSEFDAFRPGIVLLFIY